LDQNDHIIKQAQKGDEQAFKELFENFSGIVYGISLRYLKNEDDAKDLMQEAFIKMFGRLKEYKFSGSFEGWLRRLTVHMAIDVIRRKKIRFENDNMLFVEEIAEVSIPEEAISILNTKELLKLILDLPNAYGLVFNLYVIEGFKHSEIAKKLGISEGTSKSNLHDARKYLQKKLKTVLDE
jgi:RNA polymerase sigma factor (sigma-70 family)